MTGKNPNKENILASALAQAVHEGKCSIEELAEFAAYHAIQNEASAETSIKDFSTIFAIKNGGIKALAKVGKPSKRIVDVYTRNQKKAAPAGGLKLAEFNPQTVARREIFRMWNEDIAAKKVKTKKAWMWKALALPQFKDLGLSVKTLENDLKFPKGYKASLKSNSIK